MTTHDSSSQPAQPATSPSASQDAETWPTRNPGPSPAGEPAPTVGRIVHYRGHNTSPCLAALITDVRADGGVSLLVCPPHQVPRHVDARRGDSASHWHWPERA